MPGELACVPSQQNRTEVDKRPEHCLQGRVDRKPVLGPSRARASSHVAVKAAFTVQVVTVAADQLGATVRRDLASRHIESRLSSVTEPVHTCLPQAVRRQVDQAAPPTTPPVLPRPFALSPSRSTPQLSGDVVSGDAMLGLKQVAVGLVRRHCGALTQATLSQPRRTMIHQFRVTVTPSAVTTA